MSPATGDPRSISPAALTASVVICAYTMERWTWVQAAVRSALTQTVPPQEVLLVVDHNEQLLDVAAACLRGVRVVANTGPRGLSGARNTGVEHAVADVVAFLDDDAEAAPQWLALLLAAYDENVIGVGGWVEPSWQAERPAWFPDEFGWVVGCSYRGLPTRRTRVRNPIGANMSFRREVLLAAGGFSSSLGRVSTVPVGCEETELAIRAQARLPGTFVLLEPGATVRHHVTGQRATFRYFRRRCWSEGLSKARVSRLVGSGPGLDAERGYVTRTLSRGAWRGLREGARGDLGGPARAGAIVAGLAWTAAGYGWGRLTIRAPAATHPQLSTFAGAAPTGGMPALGAPCTDPTRRSDALSSFSPPAGGPAAHRFTPTSSVDFDLHGLLHMSVDASAPAVLQLADMFACFRTDTPPLTRADGRPDLFVSAPPEDIADLAKMETEYSYDERSLLMHAARAQVVDDDGQYRLHGSSELLTSALPLVDRLTVTKGAAMFHAATVEFRGHGIALPAAGGTGKTSTIAKLMKRRDDYGFMGDDWAFLADDQRMLGFAKPMFIKPHHRPLYPHLFEGTRKPLVPVALSRPVGRLTTVVHPYVIRYPRLASASRRWSPEHRMVMPHEALPHNRVTTQAPLAVCVYLERFDGPRPRLHEVTKEWMVDRMVGNFHIELPSHSQHMFTAMAACNLLPAREHFADKSHVLSKALEGIPTYLMQVPAAESPDVASDIIVSHLDRVLHDLGVA